jgi:hypothetical protein
MSYVLANRETIPVMWATQREIYKQRFKFSTTDYGLTIGE